MSEVCIINTLWTFIQENIKDTVERVRYLFFGSWFFIIWFWLKMNLVKHEEKKNLFPNWTIATSFKTPKRLLWNIFLHKNNLIELYNIKMMSSLYLFLFFIHSTHGRILNFDHALKILNTPTTHLIRHRRHIQSRAG